LASSDSTTAMASAAVTAASTAAALVPFKMSLGCLLAKGDSRKFLIEWPVVLPYLIAMTSLATVEALRWLAGASTRQSTAATWAPAGNPRPPGRRGGCCAAALIGACGSEHNSCTARTFIKLKRWLRWLGSSRLHAVGRIRCLAGHSCADKGRMSMFVLGNMH
jgi:hypothetical protein